MATQPVGDAPSAAQSGARSASHTLVGAAPAVLLELTARALRGASHMEASECLDAIAAVHVLVGLLEGARVHAVGELAARTGEELLKIAEVANPEELSATKRTQWRQQVKSVTGAEVSTLTGLGRGKARDLVAISLAPAVVKSRIQQGLGAGVARWDQVEHFWRKAGNLTPEHAAAAATRLFSTDAPARQVAVERLNPDGEIRPGPWSAKHYVEAVEREVVRAESRDPQALAAKRARAHRDRRAFGCIDDDGTGQIIITGDSASTAACVDRLHTLAKKARQVGDQRTQAQLRSDIARALLLHGTLPLPDLGQDAALVSVDDVAELAQIISGSPTYDLQVVIPWDAITGIPVWTPHGVINTPSGANEVVAQGDSPIYPPLPAVPGVGRLVGSFPRFFTDGEMREMALSPGTTMHRLLTDPADGRCIERSIAGYRPDAAMRQQILAADVLSRAPGQTLPVRDGQLDHVHEYLLGGATSESNLQGLDTVSHALKTQKFWDAEMDATRNVTWTSFFNRLYRTRSHDYRQYLHVGSATTPVADGSSCRDETGGKEVSMEERRQLASLLIYAALSARRAGEPLDAFDDYPEDDDDIWGRDSRVIWMRTTRTRDGRKVPGTHPGTPTPEEFVQQRPEAILQAEHWTEPFTRIVKPDSQPDEPPPF